MERDRPKCHFVVLERSVRHGGKVCGKINGEWAQYTWTFVAQDPPSGSQHIVLDLGRSAEVFFIDDVVVYEIPAFMCP